MVSQKQKRYPPLSKQGRRKYPQSQRDEQYPPQGQSVWPYVYSQRERETLGSGKGLAPIKPNFEICLDCG
ncbi:L-aspartate oxidase [Clarias magur]|uniref:L-aspartate oxidase n=1 Tax=Clarias magur TaxID=1594786 RepID=A0A8J4XHM4_CLAMG|nr:L-aspartate oxidase [Clarias magur]